MQTIERAETIGAPQNRPSTVAVPTGAVGNKRPLRVQSLAYRMYHVFGEDQKKMTAIYVDRRGRCLLRGLEEHGDGDYSEVWRVVDPSTAVEFFLEKFIVCPLFRKRLHREKHGSLKSLPPPLVRCYRLQLRHLVVSPRRLETGESYG